MFSHRFTSSAQAQSQARWKRSTESHGRLARYKFHKQSAYPSLNFCSSSFFDLSRPWHTMAQHMRKNRPSPTKWWQMMADDGRCMCHLCHFSLATDRPLPRPRGSAMPFRGLRGLSHPCLGLRTTQSRASTSHSDALHRTDLGTKWSSLNRWIVEVLAVSVFRIGRLRLRSSQIFLDLLRFAQWQRDADLSNDVQVFLQGLRAQQQEILRSRGFQTCTAPGDVNWWWKAFPTSRFVSHFSDFQALSRND